MNELNGQRGHTYGSKFKLGTRGDTGGKVVGSIPSDHQEVGCLLDPHLQSYQTTTSPHHLQGFHSPNGDEKIQKFEPPKLSGREGGQARPAPCFPAQG